MEKYKVRLSTAGKKIQKVEIDRETERMVWEMGRKWPKRGKYFCFCDTFDEAKALLVEHGKSCVLSARRSLEIANSYLGKIKGMKDFSI